MNPDLRFALVSIRWHCDRVLHNTRDEPERALQVSMKEIRKMADEALRDDQTVDRAADSE